MQHVLLLLAAVLTVGAQPLPDGTIQRMAEAYLAKRPVADLTTNLSRADSLSAQRSYVDQLAKSMGPKVGYKVGLVTKAGQQRMGLNEPVRGVLLKRMLLPDNSELPATYAIRPVIEADLIVTIKDEGINDARTIDEAARHIGEVVAFIELADSTLATNQPVNGAVLTAINVGARSGVLGERREWRNTSAFIQSFAKMEIVLGDETGKILADGSAASILGHPLNALVWLVQDLAKTGERLKAGDVVSLGSPVPAVSARPGQKLKMTYKGLEGGPLTARVSFK